MGGDDFFCRAREKVFLSAQVLSPGSNFRKMPLATHTENMPYSPLAA
jgi:hypothetical protein